MRDVTVGSRTPGHQENTLRISAAIDLTSWEKRVRSMLGVRLVTPSRTTAYGTTSVAERLNEKARSSCLFVMRRRYRDASWRALFIRLCAESAKNPPLQASNTFREKMAASIFDVQKPNGPALIQIFRRTTCFQNPVATTKV